MDIREQKKEIRKAVRALKNSTPQEERDAKSLAIEEKILSMGIFEQPGTILLYHALPDEVNTDLLLATLSNRREGNKRIILPVVEGEYLILKEYIPEEMSTGYRNISEPTGNLQIDPSEIELVGVCTDICVVSNAILLKTHFYSDAEISVDANCCAGVTPESHNAALTTMKMCQVNVIGG